MHTCCRGGACSFARGLAASHGCMLGRPGVGIQGGDGATVATYQGHLWIYMRGGEQGGDGAAVLVSIPGGANKNDRYQGYVRDVYREVMGLQWLQTRGHLCIKEKQTKVTYVEVYREVMWPLCGVHCSPGAPA
eukprot:1140229-Pelagomonas_calceolata.AAC.2